ncbi:acetyl-CoA C-acyltransferase [Lactobacillus sp. S2-2]|uniref:thiolase family protein n=1 Tax=Lactobacillus sp. S2-2 TaxID=2692917 RepID=UPI001F19C742|nr:acetyl-CoA C-acetyltransferase [Lactobacillus sp. S2-2]MCF6515416.1 acetyl-CoA C-acyltransferase [Lactobacillus sp. S2-2]
MKEVVIVNYKRTPIGKLNGSLKDFSAVELGTIAAKETIKETNIDPNIIDEVIFGNVVQAGNGQNVARQIQINAGISAENTAFTVNQVCGSGLKAVRLGQTAIQTEEADIVLVGGTESMTNAPHLTNSIRKNQKFGNTLLVDSLQKDGLNDAWSNLPMGITAENVAEKFNISREEQDQFSYKSHKNAAYAIENELFKNEIVSIEGKHHELINQDEGIRANTSVEKLNSLKPVFKENGSVTAGNTATINDGASAILLMSKDKAEEMGIEYLATIQNYAEAGIDPNIMGYAPYYSTKKLLKNNNQKIEDFDLYELNEAFAAQSVAVSRDLQMDPNKLNITGGAISLGHPLGDSGARILITLLDNLQRTKQKNGLAAICIGGGMGISMSIKMK